MSFRRFALAASSLLALAFGRPHEVTAAAVPSGVLSGSARQLAVRGPATPSGIASRGDWNPLVPSGGPPSPRREHCAVFDDLQDRMVIFGGRGGGDETWSLDFGASTWSELQTQV